MVKTVTAAEFGTHPEEYLEEAGRSPVYITRPDRPSRVLVDASEYDRLKEYDTRRAYYPHELPEHIKDVFRQGYREDESAEDDIVAT